MTTTSTIQSPVTIPTPFRKTDSQDFLTFMADAYARLLQALYDSGSNSLFVVHIYPPFDAVIGKQMYQITTLSDQHGLVSVMEPLPDIKTLKNLKRDRPYVYEQLLSDFSIAITTAYATEIAHRVRRQLEKRSVSVTV